MKKFYLMINSLLVFSCYKPSHKIDESAKLHFNNYSQSKIYAGQEAKKGSYPFVVNLLTTAESWSYCTASLVDSKWVITAGHCFAANSDIGSFNVVIGGHLRSGSDGQVVKVEKIFVHPNYDSESLANDIALIKLADPVSNLDSISLNSVPLNFSSSQLGHITGWGMLNVGVQTTTLQEALNLPIVPKKDCKSLYHILYNFDIAEGTICTASSTEHSPCIGDSGGPLFKIIDNKPVLVGIVSWGGIACRNDLIYKFAPKKYKDFDGYTDVAYFYPWIQSIINNN